MKEATIGRAREKPCKKREQTYESQEGANLAALGLRGGGCDWRQESWGG